MWWWWCLTALAAEPTVALPVDEVAAEWDAPLRLAGLRPGASGEAGRIYNHDAQWEVCVPRTTGPACVMLEPPRTSRQREDVAWLVVSLGQDLALSAGSPARAAATETPKPAAMLKVTAATTPGPPSASTPPPLTPTKPPPAPISPPPAPISPPPAPTRPSPSSTPVAPVAPVVSPAPPPVIPAPAHVVSPPAPVRAAEEDGPAMALDAVSEEPASDPPQAPPEPGVLVSPAAAAPSSSSLLTDLRIGVGARWQASEGQSALLSGELRGPSGPVTPAVTAVMDTPLTLSDVPLRRTWTTTAGAWTLWQPGRVELGLGLGLEHQRWWQDASLVQSTWRPQVGLRGGGCPADGPVCIAGLVGWSVRRVAEREDGAEDLTVALPLHLSIQTHLRRTR